MGEVCLEVLHENVCRRPIWSSRLRSWTEDELYLPVSEDIQK